MLFPCVCLQAWALFKGKFREGIDKPDPPTWKTRLRCALNKSNDFEELVERSQLDISDPYKVYRIIPEGAKKSQSSISNHKTLKLNINLSGSCGDCKFLRNEEHIFIYFAGFPVGPRQEDSPTSPVGYQMHPSYPTMPTQVEFIHLSYGGGGGWMGGEGLQKQASRGMHAAMRACMTGSWVAGSWIALRYAFLIPQKKYCANVKSIYTLDLFLYIFFLLARF